MRRSVPTLACAAFVLGACFHPESYDTPIPDDRTFFSRTPTEEERERCRLAVEYSKSKNGYAVLILEDDHVICEDYHGGTSQPAPHHLYSGTKSFSCALAVSLADEGKLRLDDRVSDTLTAWKTDALKSQITVRQLLAFTSGLQSDEVRLSVDGLIEHPVVGDKYSVAAGLNGQHEPGTRYEYGSQHLLAFGAYVRALTGKDPLALLEERVFSKIGFKYAGWIHDPSGNAALPYGTFTTTREWAKFGSLLMHGGDWRGQRVLSAEGLAECRRGSAVMPAYGLTFWLNAEVTADQLGTGGIPVKTTDGARLLYADGPADLYAAGGLHNERLFVVPSRGLLVLRQGGADDSWSDGAFLSRALDGIAK
jgi:CubicO group peptidase (beta-lactamase class C family)